MWVLVAIIVVIAMFAVPRFGKFLGGLLLILLVVGGAAWWINDLNQKAEEKASKTRIALSEVDLIDLKMGNSYGAGSFNLSGKIRNRSSKYSIEKMEINITLKDCANKTCDTIGQTLEPLYISVPPGQLRDIDNYVGFPDIRVPRKKWSWSYQLVSVSGK